MKKLISIILTISLIFTLASCAKTQTSDWQTSLDLGQKYLLDGNYEQAIIEFNKVIEIDPKNVEAYIGLAEIYAAQGDYESAISVLEQGHAETDNQSLQDKINELRGLAASQTEAVATADVTTLPETTTTPTTAPEATTPVSEDTANQDIASQVVKQISLGFDYSAAITEDGSLYMWGRNYYGQLGNGTAEDSSVPIKIMDNVVSVSLGLYHSAAITTDGSLYMWGSNYYGQLGNGISGGRDMRFDEEIDSNIPIKIMDDVVSISLGDYHSAAITTGGSLYTWGDNGRGQLGRAESSNIGYPLKLMDNVVSVSLGGYHSAAITTDGILYTWGNNWCGQLGNGTTEDSDVPIKIMDNVISVSLGDSYSAAITADGSLYMWGYNYDGELGNGTSGGNVVKYNEGIDSNVPIKIMNDVVSVSLGSLFSAAITADGGLYMWGDNKYGQLGNGKSGSDGYGFSYDGIIDSNVPIKIMDNVVSASLGIFHSAAITTDGSLYMWGDNSNGQLGDGTYKGSNIPIKIAIPVE